MREDSWRKKRSAAEEFGDAGDEGGHASKKLHLQFGDLSLGTGDEGGKANVPPPPSNPEPANLDINDDDVPMPQSTSYEKDAYTTVITSLEDDIVDSPPSTPKVTVIGNFSAAAPIPPRLLKTIALPEPSDANSLVVWRPPVVEEFVNKQAGAATEAREKVLEEVGVDGNDTELDMADDEYDGYDEDAMDTE
ncbi:hypothetical protein SAICODRAFT_27059 [Saitoella complicata NRRL Y-17804]|uniref:uncharacterized protein n=1 Tax=Saitoella complicata (strain BCRC 22490 / CBS 7301 / JCM 7358 / NBRC 10748 / NRRL Y-17804) TaxID=698492 RepID=UPI000866AD78|nr:uncharacterized protein SAICODRAFT_27059 [Saitoella complicata NRRL Y-17804]ODQ50988.1 hypothetical protein SAICODRAFT_27059 [Saitoella complicata NRRL Y-17804]